MENAEGREGAPKIESTYPVKLSVAAFRYIAEKLRPEYQRQLEQARRDGSFNGLGDFHKSRIARLMGSMLDQYPDKNTLPENPHLTLSAQDVSFLDRTIQRPFGAAQGRLHAELMGELKRSFTGAKTAGQVRDLSQRLKGLLHRQKKAN